jgi:hypothetical protein
MAGPRHHNLTTDSAHRVSDTVIIRRNQDPSQTVDAACLFVDMLDYWLATQQRQRLAWETGGPIPCWNESDNIQFRFNLLFNLLRSGRFVATIWDYFMPYELTGFNLLRSVMVGSASRLCVRPAKVSIFLFNLFFSLLRSVRLVATPLALLRGKPMIQVSISYGV